MWGRFLYLPELQHHRATENAEPRNQMRVPTCGLRGFVVAQMSGGIGMPAHGQGRFPNLPSALASQT